MGISASWAEPLILSLLLLLWGWWWGLCMNSIAPSLPANKFFHIPMRKWEGGKKFLKNLTNCQAPGLVRAASSRKPYVNWSSPVTLVFIYRIFQLCMTNFAQSHYLKQFVSVWEATPSLPCKVGGENVIIDQASVWVIKRSQEFKREK